jgi:hypothetical protein
VTDWRAEVDPDFCFDTEDLEISGYFSLNDDEVYAVEKPRPSVLRCLWRPPVLPDDAKAKRATHATRCTEDASAQKRNCSAK